MMSPYAPARSAPTPHATSQNQHAPSNTSTAAASSSAAHTNAAQSSIATAAAQPSSSSSPQRSDRSNNVHDAALPHSSDVAGDHYHEVASPLPNDGDGSSSTGTSDDERQHDHDSSQPHSQPQRGVANDTAASSSAPLLNHQATPHRSQTRTVNVLPSSHETKDEVHNRKHTTSDLPSMQRPSVLRSVSFFILRLLSFAFLLLCAYIRVHAWGMAFLLLYVISVGLMAFVHFSPSRAQSDKGSSGHGQSDRRTIRVKTTNSSQTPSSSPTAQSASNHTKPQPTVAPLLPFLLPGLILSVVGLLVLASFQIAFLISDDVEADVDHELLREFGMGMDGDASSSGSEIALFFVPYLVAACFFIGASIFAMWLTHRDHRASDPAWIEAAKRKRQEEESKELIRLKKKYLDKPMEKLRMMQQRIQQHEEDGSAGGAGSGAQQSPRHSTMGMYRISLRRFSSSSASAGMDMDPTYFAAKEAKIRSRYHSKLDQYRRRHPTSKVGKGSGNGVSTDSNWSWFEVKLFHPWMHVLVMILLLLIGIMQRSATSYAYFLVWSVLLLRWSFMDCRVKETRHAQPKQTDQDHSLPISPQSPEAQHVKSSAPRSSSSCASQVPADERAVMVEMAPLRSNPTTQSQSLSTSPQSQTNEVTTDKQQASGSNTTDPATPSPTPIRISASLFPSFPTSTSFPSVCRHLSLFRVYTILWLYLSLHILAKYVLRFMYSFDHLHGIGDGFDQDAVNTDGQSRWDFIFGPGSVPTSGAATGHKLEYGFHLAFLLALHLYLACLLHLARHPFLFLPRSIGSGLFGAAADVEHDAAKTKRAAAIKANRSKTDDKLKRNKSPRMEGATSHRSPRRLTIVEEEPSMRRSRAGTFDHPVASPRRQHARSSTAFAQPSSPGSRTARQHVTSPRTPSQQQLPPEPLVDDARSSAPRAHERSHSHGHSPHHSFLDIHIAASSPSPSPPAVTSPAPMSPHPSARNILPSPSPFALSPATADSPHSAPPALQHAFARGWAASARAAEEVLKHDGHVAMSHDLEPRSAGLLIETHPTQYGQQASVGATHAEAGGIIGRPPGASTVAGGGQALDFIHWLASWIGRTVWLFVPVACFLLAYLYSSYPGLPFLVCMLLCAICPLYVTLHLLPVLLLYTLALNHTIYILHLPASYWQSSVDAVSSYIVQFENSFFWSMLLSCGTIVYFAAATKFARWGLRFFEASNSLPEGSLDGSRGLAEVATLGLISPNIGMQQYKNRKEKYEMKKRIAEWKKVKKKEDEKQDMNRKDQESNPAPAAALPSSDEPELYSTPSAVHIHFDDGTSPPLPSQQRQAAAPLHGRTPSFDVSSFPHTANQAPVHAPGRRLRGHAPTANPSVQPATAGSSSDLAHWLHLSPRELVIATRAALKIQAGFRGRQERRRLRDRGLLPAKVLLASEAYDRELEAREAERERMLAEEGEGAHHPRYRRRRRSSLGSALPPRPKPPSFLHRLWRRAIHSIWLAVLVSCSYASLLVMILLYVLGILRVDLIHGVYMLFFLSHAISPWMRSKHGLIVGWSSLVIIVLYTWNLPPLLDMLTSASSDTAAWYDRIGLIRLDAFSDALWAHTSVLILSACFHRFPPEELAQAQIQIRKSKMEEEERAEALGENRTMKETEKKGGGSAPPSRRSSFQSSVSAVDHAAFGTSWYSPYRPLYRTLVTCGLLLCTAITLWAALVNSLITGGTLDSTADTSTSQTSSRPENIGVSLISLIYLLFVFALILVHQLRPGVRAYSHTRRLLFFLCLYAAGIVTLQYIYQFDGVLGEAFRHLAEQTEGKFTSFEIGMFKTSTLYRSLLTHSIILFFGVAVLRVLRLDVDPMDGESISERVGSKGTSEVLCSWLEHHALRSDKQIRLDTEAERAEHEVDRAEKCRLIILQKRQLYALELEDLDQPSKAGINTSTNTNANAKLKAQKSEELSHLARAQRHADEELLHLREVATAARAKASFSREYASPSATLFLHFLARISLATISFIDWFLLQHADKILVLTLFLVAKSLLNVMGGWYMILALIILLTMGSPRAKALACIFSSQIFILLLFLWHFPVGEDVASLSSTARETYVIFGLERWFEGTEYKDFGSLILPHLAVLLVAAFYGLTEHWLRLMDARIQEEEEEGEEAQDVDDEQAPKAIEQQAEDTDMTAKQAWKRSMNGREVGRIKEENEDDITREEEGDERPSRHETDSTIPTSSNSRSDTAPTSIPPMQRSSTELVQQLLTSSSESQMHPMSGTIASGIHQGSHPTDGTLIATGDAQSVASPPSPTAVARAQMMRSLLSMLPNDPTRHPGLHLTPTQQRALALYSHLQTHLMYREPQMSNGYQSVQSSAAHLTSTPTPLTVSEEERCRTQAMVLESMNSSAIDSGAHASSHVRNVHHAADDEALEYEYESDDDNEDTHGGKRARRMRRIKSWMRHVPMAERPRWERMKERMDMEDASRSGASRSRPHTLTHAFSSPQLASRMPAPWTTASSHLSAPRAIPSAIGGRRSPASSSTTSVHHSPAITSPATVTDDARVFALASSHEKLNQTKVDTSKLESRDNIGVGMRPNAVVNDEQPPLDMFDAATTKDGSIDNRQYVSWTNDPEFDRSLHEVTQLSGAGTTAFGHRFVRGLLGSEGFFVFCARFLHYFGFYHLALMSLLCASYSNSNTILSLYFIFVAGLVSYAGTRRANRHWRGLVWTLTLAIVVKYAIGLANESSDYRCTRMASSDGAINGDCSEWLIYLGARTGLYYWDIVAWMLVAIHYSFLRIQTKLEQAVQDHLREKAEEEEMEEIQEPWESLSPKRSGKKKMKERTPLDKAAGVGMLEGSVETYVFNPEANGVVGESEKHVTNGSEVSQTPAQTKATLAAWRSEASSTPNRSRPPSVIVADHDPTSAKRELPATEMTPIASTTATTGMLPSPAQPQVYRKFSPSIQPPFDFIASGHRGSLSDRRRSQRALSLPSPRNGTASSAVATPAAQQTTGTGSSSTLPRKSPMSRSGFVSHTPHRRDSIRSTSLAPTRTVEPNVDGMDDGNVPALQLMPDHGDKAPADEPDDNDDYDDADDIDNESVMSSATPSLSDEDVVVDGVSGISEPEAPTDFPTYRPLLSQMDPIPTYITITYTTIHNQLSSYLVKNFMPIVGHREVDGRREQYSVSDVCHYVIFRSAHFIALFLVLALATTYFNLFSMIYLILVLIVLWKGDRVLDGDETFQWDRFYLLSYVIILLRLLYQLPVFSLAQLTTHWATVLGLYKTSLDGCNLDTANSPSAGASQSLLDSDCIVTPYTGLTHQVLIPDILIFGTALLMRTILSRKENLFVRFYIRASRRLAKMRAELLELREEHKRLMRTYEEQRDAAVRLQRIVALQQIKWARELALTQARIDSGTEALIRNWEAQGHTLGIAESRQPLGQDDDALTRASIRNHAITLLAARAREASAYTISVQQLGEAAPLEIISESHKDEQAGASRAPSQTKHSTSYRPTIADMRQAPKESNSDRPGAINHPLQYQGPYTAVQQQERRRQHLDVSDEATENTSSSSNSGGTFLSPLMRFAALRRQRSPSMAWWSRPNDHGTAHPTRADHDRDREHDHDRPLEDASSNHTGSKNGRVSFVPTLPSAIDSSSSSAANASASLQSDPASSSSSSSSSSSFFSSLLQNPISHTFLSRERRRLELVTQLQKPSHVAPLLELELELATGNTTDLQLALRTTAFEIRIIEKRMKKLQRDPLLASFNHDEHRPLLVMKMLEWKPLANFMSIFSRKKYAVFQDPIVLATGNDAEQNRKPASASASSVMHDHIGNAQSRRASTSVSDDMQMEHDVAAPQAGSSGMTASVPPMSLSDSSVPADSEQVAPTSAATVAAASMPDNVSSAVLSGHERRRMEQQYDDLALVMQTQPPVQQSAEGGDTAPIPATSNSTSTSTITSTSPSSPAAQSGPEAAATTTSTTAASVSTTPSSTTTSSSASTSSLPLPTIARMPDTTTSETVPDADADGMTESRNGFDATKQLEPEAEAHRNERKATPEKQPNAKPPSTDGQPPEGDGGDDLHDFEPNLPVQLWRLLQFTLLQHTKFLIVFFFLLEFLVFPSILTVIYPLSLFFYALLVEPRPGKGFWKWMIVYTSLLILTLFIFQLPALCVCTTLYGQRFSICSSSSEQSCPVDEGTELVGSESSVQSLVGLYKVTSREEALDGTFMTFVFGVFLHLCTLAALLLHRRYLRRHGLWLSRQSMLRRRRMHELLMTRLVRQEIMKEKVIHWHRTHSQRFKKDIADKLPTSSHVKGHKAHVEGGGGDDVNNALSSATPLLGSKVGTQLAKYGPSVSIISDQPTILGAATTSASDATLDVTALLVDMEQLRTEGGEDTNMDTEIDEQHGDMPQLDEQDDVPSRSASDGTVPIVTAISSAPASTTPRLDSTAISSLHRSLSEGSSSASSSDTDSIVPSRGSVNATRHKPSFLRRLSGFMSGRGSHGHGKGNADDESGDETTALLGGDGRSKMLDPEFASRPRSSSIQPESHAHTSHVIHAKQKSRLRAALRRQTLEDLNRALKAMPASGPASTGRRQELLQKERELERQEKERNERHKARRAARKKAKEQAKRQREECIRGTGKDAESFASKFVDTTYKPGRDYYVMTFVIQLLQFFVLVIFYNLSGATGNIEQNYISPEFVVVIFAQFVLIVLERIVYLYRNLLAKLILQLSTLIIFFAVVLFVGLQSVALLSVVYVLMCIYWVLGCLQFFHGYPPNVQGQFLAKSTHWIPWLLFVIYRAIPFVFELRTLLDWYCTDTVLYFPEWLKFEDIYATFYLTLRGNDSKRTEPRPAGRLQGWLPKLAIGMGLFLVLIILVWGPLFLFSSQSATSPNPVLQTDASATIPGFVPLYSTSQTYIVSGSAAGRGNEVLSDDQYARLVAGRPFLNDMRQRALQIIYPQSSGSGVWSVSPFARTALIQSLSDPRPDVTMPLEFSFQFLRSTSTAAPITHFRWTYQLSQPQRAQMVRIINATNAVSNDNSATNSSALDGGNTPLPEQSSNGTSPLMRLAKQLHVHGGDGVMGTSASPTSSRHLLQSTPPSPIPSNSSDSVFLPRCYPSFFFMSSVDASGPVDLLSTAPESFADCVLTLRQATDALGKREEWWMLRDANIVRKEQEQQNGAIDAATDVTSASYVSNYHGADLSPPLYMYSGEIPSSSALNIGLVGVYVTVVLTIGQFLRLHVMGMSKNVQWDDMLDARPVLQMCRDVYTARLHRQFKMEEQLYVELINLLRSPEALMAKTGEFIHYWPQDETQTDEEAITTDTEGDEDEDDTNDSDHDTGNHDRDERDIENGRESRRNSLAPR